jgi:hypothetical protein
MIVAAPASRSPWVTAMPMPPAPVTSAVAPVSTRAVLSTAPTPVCTAQPMTQASPRSTSSPTFTAASWGTTVYSAHPPTPTPRYTVSPPRDKGLVPSGRVAVYSDIEYLAHSVGWLRTHQ